MPVISHHSGGLFSLDKTKQRKGARVPSDTFPGGPVVGDLFYHTVLKTLYVWDGSNWRTLGGPYVHFSQTGFGALTTSGTTPLTLVSFTLAGLPLNTLRFVECHVNVAMSQTVVGDIFDIQLIDSEGAGQRLHRTDTTRTGATSHSFSAAVPLNTNASNTISLNIQRVAGSGTATMVTDGRFSNIFARGYTTSSF